MDKKILDRYNSAEGAISYAGKFRRHWAERVNDWHERRLVRRLLAKTLEGERAGSALDLPCGWGRMYPIVREFSERVIEGDWSFHLLSLARENQADLVSGAPGPAYVRATALNLPFPDGAFDLVLSVRLCHHIRDHEERLRYVREVMRVSRRWVVFTYLDGDSLKNRIREWVRRFIEKRAKWTLTAAEIKTLAAEQGFEALDIVALSRLFSGHRYVALRRG